MAKVTLENTREHDITVNVVGSDGLVQVTVPSARQNPNDKDEIINGRAEADDAFVEEAKKNPVIAHYFEEGWLRITKPESQKKAAKE